MYLYLLSVREKDGQCQNEFEGDEVDGNDQLVQLLAREKQLKESIIKKSSYYK